MANSRAAKNLAQSKGKSIGRLIVDTVSSGVEKVKDAYVKSHKEKQQRLNDYGTSGIFK